MGSVGDRETGRWGDRVVEYLYRQRLKSLGSSDPELMLNTRNNILWLIQSVPIHLVLYPFPLGSANRVSIAWYLWLLER
jgi:hypothetical protein